MSKTARELGVRSVYFDSEASTLYSDDEGTEDCLIEEWPSDWPKYVTAEFLRSEGFIIL